MRARTLGLCTVTGLLLLSCKKKEDDAAIAAAASASAAALTASAVASDAASAAPAPRAAHVAGPKVDHSADANAIRACCAALQSGATKGSSKSSFESAAKACTSMGDLVQKGTTSRASALGSIRAALRGGTLPSTCN